MGHYLSFFAPIFMDVLSQAQRDAASALAAGMSLPLAAKAAGVSLRTAQRWQKLEAFQRAVRGGAVVAAATAKVDEAKRAEARGFSLVEAISSLRKFRHEYQTDLQAIGNEILDKCREALGHIDPADISIRDLPVLLRVGSEMLGEAIASQSEEIEIDQLVEEMLGPGSVIEQKVEIESEAAVERMFQAIALSAEIPAGTKQVFYRLLGSASEAP